MMSASQLQSIPDLLSMAPAAPKDDGQFTDFVGAAPVKQDAGDGFSDFMGGNSVPNMNSMPNMQAPMAQ